MRNPFNWAIVLAVFVLLTAILWANPPESTLITASISGGPDIPQISDVSETPIENTGSDIWSEFSGDVYDYMVYLCEVNILKLPQISRANYKSVVFNGLNILNVFAVCDGWNRGVNAYKHIFII